MNPSFWKGRRVFITGHTGFKGGWLSLWLQSMGAEVTGFSLEPPTNPSLFMMAQVGQGMTSIIGDVRNREMLAHAVRHSRPEVVVHMAAQPLVRHSYDHPVDTYATNVMGTVHLLEAVRLTDTVRAVVLVTSDKCYENQEWIWGYRENEPMGGFDPYSNSKGCAELVASAYRSSFFNSSKYQSHRVALASARAGNVIGGGDWAQDRLIPDFMRALEESEPISIRSPNAIRPWQHVLEPLSGYLLLAERLVQEGAVFAEAWNFGPSDIDVKPVEWIVQRLCELWKNGASWTLDKTSGHHEANYLKLDSSKARNFLGWKSIWDLNEALIKIVDWYRVFHMGNDLRAETLSQIDEFQRQSMA